MLQTTSDLRLRAPAPADAPEVARLVNGSVLRQIGMALLDAGELRSEWEHTDSLDHLAVMEAGDGIIVGYLTTTEVDREDARIFFEGYTAEDALGRGIGAALVDEACARASALAKELGKPVKLETDVNTDAARKLLARSGFEVTWESFAMFMDLDRPTPSPVWPDGIELRSFHPGVDDEDFFGVMCKGFDMEATSDIASWRQRQDLPGFDPTLWWLAQSSEGPVAALECRSQWHVQSDTGWIKNLAVLAEWRRRGVARALLFHAFREFRRRGRTRAVLGVDASNPTGARAFYEHIGMYVGSTNTDHRKIVPPIRAAAS